MGTSSYYKYNKILFKNTKTFVFDIVKIERKKKRVNSNQRGRLDLNIRTYSPRLGIEKNIHGYRLEKGRDRTGTPA
jgi:hypothetical protein